MDCPLGAVAMHLGSFPSLGGEVNGSNWLANLVFVLLGRGHCPVLDNSH